MRIALNRKRKRAAGSSLRVKLALRPRGKICFARFAKLQPVKILRVGLKIRKGGLNGSSGWIFQQFCFVRVTAWCRSVFKIAFDVLLGHRTHAYRFVRDSPQHERQPTKGCKFRRQHIILCVASPATAAATTALSAFLSPWRRIVVLREGWQ